MEGQLDFNLLKEGQWVMRSWKHSSQMQCYDVFHIDGINDSHTELYTMNMYCVYDDRLVIYLNKTISSFAHRIDSILNESEVLEEHVIFNKFIKEGNYSTIKNNDADLFFIQNPMVKLPVIKVSSLKRLLYFCTNLFRWK